MEKRTLIGFSICALVLIVLASFPSVVGYQQIKSATIQKSKNLKSVQNYVTQLQSLLSMNKKMHPALIGFLIGFLLLALLLIPALLFMAEMMLLIIMG